MQKACTKLLYLYTNVSDQLFAWRIISFLSSRPHRVTLNIYSRKIVNVIHIHIPIVHLLTSWNADTSRKKSTPRNYRRLSSLSAWCVRSAEFVTLCKKVAYRVSVCMIDSRGIVLGQREATMVALSSKQREICQTREQAGVVGRITRRAEKAMLQIWSQLLCSVDRR